MTTNTTTKVGFYAMNHQQHADAAANRLEAITATRHELARLAELPEKTPGDWARISELKLQLQLAYDGAGVHAAIAVYGAIRDLTEAIGQRPGAGTETV